MLYRITIGLTGLVFVLAACGEGGERGASGGGLTGEVSPAKPMPTGEAVGLSADIGTAGSGPVAALARGLGGAGSTTPWEQLVELEDEPPGSNCEFGGTKIVSGLDEDRGGTLSPSEVNAVAYSCYQRASLQQDEPESAGANCQFGGTAVHGGSDDNANGLLDGDEIETTTYVCFSNVDQLMRVDDEGPGANCENGGKAVHSGSDLDGNGTLDAQEVVSTEYVCHEGDPLGWKVLEGSFIVRNALDAMQVAQFNEVTGAVTVAAEGMAEMPISTNLNRVGRLAVEAITGLQDLALFRGLDEVAGDLAIAAPDLVSLDDLGNLRGVGGELVLQESTPGVFAALETIGGGLDLKSEVGFPSLRSIGGDLTVIDSASLTTLIGLTALEEVQGRVELSHNTALEGVVFPSLQTVGGDFIVSGCDVATTSDLGALEAVGGSFRLVSNAGLVDPALPLLRTIDGDLIVEDMDGVTSLSGFSAVETVGGDLRVAANIWLVELGLASLSSVDGGLHVLNNRLLQNLSGLDSVGSIGRDLEIHRNVNLSSVQSLSSVAVVPGHLDISRNLRLSSLEGLDSVTEVGGTLSIFVNRDLVDVSALGSLVTIGGDLIVESNSKLASMSSLGALVSIGGALLVKTNPSLTEIEGFESLTTVNNDFVLTGNRVMTTIPSFGALTQVGGDLVLEHYGTVIDLHAVSQVGGLLDISSRNSDVEALHLDSLSSVGEGIRLLNMGDLMAPCAQAELCLAVGLGPSDICYNSTRCGVARMSTPEPFYTDRCDGPVCK